MDTSAQVLQARGFAFCDEGDEEQLQFGAPPPEVGRDAGASSEHEITALSAQPKPTLNNTTTPITLAIHSWRHRRSR